MIKCPNCGGELKYDIKDQEVTCPFCESKFNPTDTLTSVKHASEHESYDGSGGTSYTCSQCGATLMSFDETAVTFCNFCDSQALIQSKMDFNSPDYIIPFKKTKEECIQIYKNTLAKALFAPKYMKNDIVFNKIRGIFMPYGIYKVGFHGTATNKGEKYSHRMGDYVFYDQYKITSHVDAEYDGISFDLVSKFYDNYSGAIPFDYKEIEPFNYNYLISFYADVKDVNDALYEDDAANIGTKDSVTQMSKHKDFMKYGCSSPQVEMQVIEKKNALFPVYFACIKDKSGTRVHYAVINGQTGEVAIDLPIDFVKYVIGSLLLAGLIFLLTFILPVITNFGVCIIAAIASVIAIIITGVQLSQLKDAELFDSDEGYLSSIPIAEQQERRKQYKMKGGGIFKNIFPLIIALVLPILMVIFDPVNDVYFYGAAIISLVIITLSFYGIVKRYNILSSRPLPQLNKRGGDLSE